MPNLTKTIAPCVNQVKRRELLSALLPAAVLVTIAVLIAGDTFCFASFESSLVSMKSKLTGIVLPLLSVIGLGLAALSFFSGNPQAKQHVIYAIFGCIFGFGAQVIVDFISQAIQ